MKPFKFRLESVLKYRRFMEKKEMMRLMRHKKACEDVIMSIRHLNAQRSDMALKCSRAGAKGASVFEYLSYKAYLHSLQEDIDAAQLELMEKEHRVREQEAVLKKETIRKKVLERLRELRFEDHREMIAKLEQKQLDELVINKRGVPV
jgi:flagellar FliJ protein